MRRPSSSRTPSSTASRCGRSTSTSATGTARSNGRRRGRRCGSASAWFAAFGRSTARAIEEVRKSGPFTSFDDLANRTRLSSAALQRLAKADAFRSFPLERRTALWRALPSRDEYPLFARMEEPETPIAVAGDESVPGGAGRLRLRGPVAAAAPDELPPRPPRQAARDAGGADGRNEDGQDCCASPASCCCGSGPAPRRGSRS